MNFDQRLRKGSRSGVSEVVGALLLILVVVVAVAGFALYLSSAQSAAEQREAYQSGVKNEDLQITSLSLFPSDPYTQFEFYLPNSSATCSPTAQCPVSEVVFYIHYINDSYVSIYNGSDYDFTYTTGLSPTQQYLGFNCPSSAGYAPCTNLDYPLGALTLPIEDFNTGTSEWVLGEYNEISINSSPLWLCNTDGLVAGTQTPDQAFISFVNPTTGPSEIAACSTSASGAAPNAESTTIQAASWDNANVTIRNFNTLLSNLRDIEFNDNFVANWTELPSPPVEYNATGLTMPILPESSSEVEIDVANYNVTKTSSLLINLLAADGNIFEFSYPVPDSLISTVSSPQYFGTTIKDVISLQANPVGNESVANYIWRIDALESHSPTLTVFESGVAIQLDPQSMFAGNPVLPTDNVTGPYTITLMTVNAIGQVSLSSPLITPQDNNTVNLAMNPVCVSGTPGQCTVTVSASVSGLSSPMYFAGVPITITAISPGVSLTVAGTSCSSQPTCSVETSAANSNDATPVVAYSGTGVVEISAPNITPMEISVS